MGDFLVKKKKKKSEREIGCVFESWSVRIVLNFFSSSSSFFHPRLLFFLPLLFLSVSFLFLIGVCQKCVQMTYRVDLFDSFDKVDDRIGEGRKWVLAASEFFSKKAALDKEYSKKLASLVKQSENDFG